MHTIVWFWTVGKHDPAWVQAAASVALFVLTVITLIVLGFYARDTHTLAKISVEQIQLAKDERAVIAMRNHHMAYNGILQVQRSVVAAIKLHTDGTLLTKQQRCFYPDNWVNVTSALNERDSRLGSPAISLGLILGELDYAIEEFRRATSDKDFQEANLNVAEWLQQACQQCIVLTKAIEATATDSPLS